MQKNVGQKDRNVRIAAGLAILLLGLLFQSWWGLIGLIPLVTAFIGWCPAYMPMGFSTSKVAKDSTSEKGGEV